MLRFSGPSILIPFFLLDIFDDVSGVTIPVVIFYCYSGVLPRSVCFLIFLTFLSFRILLWLRTDDPLLESLLLELLSSPSSSPPPAFVPHPKGGVRSLSSAQLFLLPGSEVCSTMPSSDMMPDWDPVLTSGVERCLVGVSGGSLLSCPFGRLAIGGSSNSPSMVGRMRYWPHRMQDIILTHSFRT